MMRVFVTGASGFVGSAFVPELIGVGHQVLGLARSDKSAAALEAAGADVQRGSLGDLDSLRAGASASDGVIHLAFIHNFEDFANAAEAYRAAIEAIGETLVGSDRPLVVASGLVGLRPGGVATEEDSQPPASPRFSEAAAFALAERGVRASAVRLAPTVHGEGDKGFVPQFISVAREKGVSAYPGDGTNRWPAVHRLDVARLFRLALGSAPAGTRLHAVGEEGIPVRQIAEALGAGLGLPTASTPVEEAHSHFGWIGPICALDGGASSELTRQRFGWKPEQPELIADLAQGHYFN